MALLIQRLELLDVLVPSACVLQKAKTMQPRPEQARPKRRRRSAIYLSEHLVPLFRGEGEFRLDRRLSTGTSINSRAQRKRGSRLQDATNLYGRPSNCDCRK